MFVWLLLSLPCQLVETPTFDDVSQQNALVATVRITDHSDRSGTTGSGSIVGIDDRSFFVLTANHVVSPGTDLEIQLFSSKSYPKPQRTFRENVQVRARLIDSDLALVQVKTEFRPRHVLSVRGLMDLPSRQQVLRVGCANGSAPKCVVDRLQGTTLLKRPNGLVKFWVTKAVPQKGCSGGPLIDELGQIIGTCRGFLGPDDIFPAEGLFSSLQDIHQLLANSGINTSDLHLSDTNVASRSMSTGD